MTRTTRILGAALFAMMIGTHARAGQPRFWGVNDSGLEMGRGDKVNKNYVVPKPGYFLDHGVRLVRVPFRPTRLQPIALASLDPAFLATMQKIVAQNHAAGALTVLDPHAYGFLDINNKPRDIAHDPDAAIAYVDLMRRLAAAFVAAPVAIDLMNEPHTATDEQYAPVWNQAIAAIRQAGFRGVILVPHTNYSRAADISPQHPFPASGIVDSAHNWVLELHSYLDPDGSGVYRQAVASEAIGASRLDGAIAWSRATKIRVFLGETGTPSDPASLSALLAMLERVKSAPDVFWGIALWGGGPWFKPDYPMRLDPVGSSQAPQFQALEHLFGDG